MGFFSGLKKVFKKVVKPVIKVAQKATTVVATGGLSLVSKDIRNVGNAYTSQLFPTSFQQAVNIGLGVATKNPALFLPQNVQGGSQPMAFNIGGFVGQVGGILGKSQIGGLQNLGAVASLASGFIPQKSMATPVAKKSMSAPSAALPTIIAGGAGAGKLTQEIVNMGAILLQKLGIKVNSIAQFAPALKRALGSIASLARRLPGGSMVSILIGLGLTNYAANLLTAWYAQRKKHRRMNPANSRALRRAARRIKSFHRLCTHTDLIRSGSRHRPSYSRGRSCSTCRKSPCAC